MSQLITSVNICIQKMPDGTLFATNQHGIKPPIKYIIEFRRAISTMSENCVSKIEIQYNVVSQM
jgi:hypothetical protein